MWETDWRDREEALYLSIIYCGWWIRQDLVNQIAWFMYLIHDVFIIYVMNLSWMWVFEIKLEEVAESSRSCGGEEFLLLPQAQQCFCSSVAVAHMCLPVNWDIHGNTCGDPLLSLPALRGHWQQCVDQRLPGVSRALNFLLWHVLGFLDCIPRHECDWSVVLVPSLFNWWAKHRDFKMIMGGMQAVVWSIAFNLSPFVTLNWLTEEQEAIHKLLVSSGVRELATFPSPFFFQ